MTMKNERRYRTEKITPKMEAYIKDHHGFETPFLMAHKLCVSDQTIYNYLNRYGLSVYVHRWSKDNKLRLVRLLSRGDSIYRISSYFGITMNSVRKEIRILKNQGMWTDGH